MPNLARNTVTTIIPTLRYDDAPKAIDWLCNAFGFEKQAVYADDNGIVQHAQLVFGNGMIMLSSTANAGVWGERIAQPRSIGGRETQCACVIVSDCDAHYARAIAAGAEILDALETKEYGGAGYSCRDPEGHIWWFGSYDPWEEHKK